MNNNETNHHSGHVNTVQVAKMGILMAISVLLVYLIRFPIIPAAPFLEYDPADVAILIGGFAFGPIAGIVLTVITSVVQGFTVSAQSGVYGIIMHIIATGTFVLVSGLIYKKNKTKLGGALGLLFGGLAMTAIMMPANYFVTPIFTGMPPEAVVKMLPVIAFFNIIKVSINGLITFLLYKHISGFLHRDGFKK